MKKTALCFLLVAACVFVRAQVSFKTIITQGPVVAGESFQVQYVIEDMAKEDEFFPPVFNHFGFVSGPNIYGGSAYGINGPVKVKNIVYALKALKPGKFILPGASARVNGQLIRSDDVALVVISQQDAAAKGLLPQETMPNTDYFLRPGEDPYAKMRRNLFVKVQVDKKTCYVGQPVTATFRLYSRLESRSDIVKNPGFYGFTVQDMVGLKDKLTVTETINGDRFDVHTVRKVQLYPLRAGIFTIDAMEVMNKVEFSKRAVHKKTEQEIEEGIFSDMISPDEHTAVFENTMSTEEVSVVVKPLPVKQPADFNGATGKFSVTASLLKNELKKNEEGDLLVIVKGSGNFTQLSAPVIKWPAGIEGFEAEIEDSLDHSVAPLKGERKFLFRFVSARPGIYTIPGVSLSFFDPDSNRYKTVATAPLKMEIANTANKAGLVNSADRNFLRGNGHSYAIWIGVMLLVLAGALIFWWLFKKRKQAIAFDTVSTTAQQLPGVNELLKPAFVVKEADDKIFYTTLRHCIWEFFISRLALSGSRISKPVLRQAMREKNIGTGEQELVFDLLDQCETGMFTSAATEADKNELLSKAKEVLLHIDAKVQ